MHPKPGSHEPLLLLSQQHAILANSQMHYRWAITLPLHAASSNILQKCWALMDLDRGLVMGPRGKPGPNPEQSTLCLHIASTAMQCESDPPARQSQHVNASPHLLEPHLPASAQATAATGIATKRERGTATSDTTKTPSMQRLTTTTTTTT